MSSAEEMLDRADARSVADFAAPSGRDLLKRTHPFVDWTRARSAAGEWPYTRSLHGAPEPVAEVADSQNRLVKGLNFASQDYLGLAAHPAVRAAAAHAAMELGAHSGSSPAFQGQTRESLTLADELAQLLELQHVMLFPSG